MTKRAVLYARVSGDDRAKEGRNLGGQLEMCRQYAIERGWNIIAELYEDDRGAKSDELDLEKLSQIREMARAGAFDVLVVRELDRLARSLAKQLFVEYDLQKAGVQVEYVLGEYPDTPEGIFLKNVKASVVEYERLKIVERTARGREIAVSSGSVLVYGKPPYGYKVIQEGGRYQLEPDEEEAKVVRMIFRWYTEGDVGGIPLSIRAIARKLTRMGVPTYADKRQEVIGNKSTIRGRWSAASVHHILKNEVYVGIWRFGKHSRQDGKHTKTTKEEQIPVEVPALITRETWNLVQEKLESNKQDSRRNRKYDYLLSGRVTCGMCGAKMSASNRTRGQNRYFYYTCNARTTPDSYPHTCKAPYYRGDHLDEAVWQWVKSLLLNPDVMAEGLRAQQEASQSENISASERLTYTEELLQKNLEQQEKLLDLYLDGNIPKETWSDRQQRLASTIKELEGEVGQIKARIEAQFYTDEQIQAVHELAKSVSKNLELADENFEVRRRIIELLDVQVELWVDDDGQKRAKVSCILGENLLSVVPNSTSGARS
ncbi:recombinase family protein [Chloroflexi bacterium TSY]|nr:recombinase family protein [Chloroflexi bacterium TSY]